VSQNPLDFRFLVFSLFFALAIGLAESGYGW
jgi:hypothetical protein